MSFMSYQCLHDAKSNTRHEQMTRKNVPQIMQENEAYSLYEPYTQTLSARKRYGMLCRLQKTVPGPSF